MEAIEQQALAIGARGRGVGSVQTGHIPDIRDGDIRDG